MMKRDRTPIVRTYPLYNVIKFAPGVEETNLWRASNLRWSDSYSLLDPQVCKWATSGVIVWSLRGAAVGRKQADSGSISAAILGLDKV